MNKRSQTQSSTLVFFCNGKKITDENVDPETTLLTYLRRKLHLTGTKLGCAEGGCGACTVMVSYFNHTQQKIRHISVNACLAPICSVHGKAVTTVEGIGSIKTKLHPVQERLAAAHGSQCGFCTPGIVMSMYTLLRNNAKPSMDDIFETLQGNLCRCTGYRAILEGYRTFSKGCGIPNCCQSGVLENGIQNEEAIGLSTDLFRSQDFAPYDESQEVIFPPELRLERTNPGRLLTFCGSRVTWFLPVTLSDLMELKSTLPDSKLIVGNTEIGVEVKFKHQFYPVLIDVSNIPEMGQTTVLDNGISVGSSVSLSQLEEFLREVIEQRPEHQTRTYAAIVEILTWFAGPQVRNVASVGGNIATGSPISDLNPLFMASGTLLTVASVTGFRTISMKEDFFIGYRKTILSQDEVLVKIFVPFTTENEFVCGFKQSSRKEDDIAIVNAGMRVEFVENTNLVHDITLVYGGMAPTTKMAAKTMDKLKGKNWNESLLEEATKSLHSELSLLPGVPGGMEVYRQSLTLSFFFKFYLKVLNNLNLLNVSNGINNTQLSEIMPDVPDSFKTVISETKTTEFRSTQLFQEVSCDQLQTDAVGRPIPLKSARQQTTGEAKYVNDLPKIEGELYVAFVFSEKAHAKIISMDFSEVLALDGVVDVVSHVDVPGSNLITPSQDEELFAVEEVFWAGQIVALVVAENQATAQRGAKLVKVGYEELDYVLTIEDAIDKQSFHEQPLNITTGDIDDGFNDSDTVVEGECHVGAQEHFYLETMTSIIIPKGEDEEMEVISSTQNLTEVQLSVAMALGIPKNRIVCRAKRLGGAFGGKETRCCIFSAAAAVAAFKLCKPVRYMLDRDEDMISTGTRHPFLGRYKVGFTKEGKVLALDLRLYSNCGGSLDLSFPVLETALFHCENVYKVPNLRVCGYLCKTNIPSCTAFRGFGAPQSMFIAESWMTAVAKACGLPQEKVRELNFYKEGDATHFRQVLHDWNLDRCWQSCLEKSSYAARRKQVTKYNRNNRWKKRGLAITPTKFGIGFTAKFLNQAGALVHIYTDGTVLVTHGGIEMGQGLHTKLIQVASRALGIPKESIHISETSTDKVPNTSPTAASTGSDLNGMAVQNACNTLVQRLEKYKAKNPTGNWTDWVKAAYMDRTSLSATGFYKTPDVTGYDWTDRTSNGTRPSNYFCLGSAVSEVEIDCLTGDHQILRTDIVMDVGDSLNPALDIGQVEGAFVQGYGLFVLEDYRYSPSGHLLTKGPGFYKIPSFGDIPKQFNVFLLDRSPNVRAVCSSKAVGEPPLFLAASTFFAIKDAISSARADAGLTGDFRLDSPACAERIRLACQDEFVKMTEEPIKGTYRPFFVRP